MSADLVVEELARRLDARRVGREWRALCPVHDDSSPSLDFHDTGERLLFTCRAGCASADVFAAVRERHPDLFERPSADEHEWEIVGETGRVVAVHVRYRRRDGAKGYSWRLPDGTRGLGGTRAADLPLYGLPALLEARREAEGDNAPLVVMCEGERATDAARALGFVAVGTVTGASSVPGDAALRHLEGCRVALWPDADPPGRLHMGRIAARLTALGVEVAGSVTWPDAPSGGDAADFRGSRDDVLALVHSGEAEASASEAPGFRLVSMAEVVDLAEAELRRFSSGDTSRLVPTGIRALDHALHGGFRRGTVSLIGAPTGAGKTTLASVLAAAAGDAGGCLFVSPEMSASELTEREIVRHAGIGRAQRAPWRLPEHREAAIAAHNEAARGLRECRTVLILDEAGASMETVEAAATEAQRRLPQLAAVILDYAQVLGAGDARTPRYLQVGAVGSTAVEIARRLDVAVILTTQVNTLKGADGPGFAVRESQMLEHVASIVMFLSVAYDEDPSTGRREVREARLRAAKHRHGALFSIELDYRPELFAIAGRSVPS